MRSRGYLVTVRQESDMAAVKRRLRVPIELASCHTAVVDGYVVEGHVPEEAVAKLVRSEAKNPRHRAPWHAEWFSRDGRTEERHAPRRAVGRPEPNVLHVLDFARLERVRLSAAPHRCRFSGSSNRAHTGPVN
jgi:hypothetical protein